MHSTVGRYPEIPEAEYGWVCSVGTHRRRSRLPVFLAARQFKESGVDARTESKINESSGLAGDVVVVVGQAMVGGGQGTRSLSSLVASKILFF